MSAEREARLVALARDQKGLVTLAQLEELRFSRTFIRARLASGAWQKLQRSVIKLSAGEPTLQEREVAALLAFGGVLSHSSAAKHHGIDQARNWKVEITVPHDRRVRGVTRGVEVWRTRDLPEGDIETEGVLRYTSLGRTVLDEAAVLPPHWLRAMVDAARRKNPKALEEIWLALSRHGPGKQGALALRKLLAEYHEGHPIPDSELESLAADIGPKTGHRPLVHFRVEGANDFQKVLDLSWPELKLAIELDGFEAHGSREAFEGDRKTDRNLRSVGWRVERFTRRQVMHDRNAFLQEVTAIFRQRSRECTG